MDTIQEGAASRVRLLPSELKVLNDTIIEINNHPNLEDAINLDENGVRWLEMTNINNEHIEADTKMKELLLRLSDEIYRLFISDEGDHTELFYKIAEYGFKMRESSRDRFGPLGAVMIPPNSNWQVGYG